MLFAESLDSDQTARVFIERPMLSKQQLRELLIEGRSVNSHRYRERCVTNHVKTFYFFCERLSMESINVALSSTVLNDYIVSQLRERKVVVENQFNPQGWFGKAWTDWVDPAKNEQHFKNEYMEVLIRTGKAPYSYYIRPECFRDVIEIFDEFKPGTLNQPSAAPQ